MARRISSRDVWIVLANTLALAALLALTWRLRVLVSWILAATVLALAFEPVLQALMRRGLKRGWAVLLVCVGLLGFVTLLLATLVPLVVAQTRALIDRLPQLLEHLQQWGPVQWLDIRLDVVDRAQDAIEERGAAAAGPALGVATSILHGLFAVVSVFMLTVFMMAFGHGLVRGAMDWLPPSTRPRWERLGARLQHIVGGYVLGTLCVSSVGGVVMGTTMLVLGVPYFVALALVMVVLGLIPFLGSMLAAILIVGVTLSTAGTSAGVIALVIYLVYQQLENHLLQPLVQRRTMRMNPLLVSVALLGGTMLAGIVGTLLALPVAGALQVIFQDARAQRTAKWAEASARAPAPTS